MGIEFEELKKLEAHGLRRSAFFGIAISTVATLTSIVAVPMLYNYVQHVQSSLTGELEFCKYRTDGLWNEYQIVEEATGYQGRLKREVQHHGLGKTGRNLARARGTFTYSSGTAEYSQSNAAAAAARNRPYNFQGEDTCCSCGVGTAGPPGPPGSDGENGTLPAISKIEKKQEYVYFMRQK